jgi:outer membrane lipoprotein SlyB
MESTMKHVWTGVVVVAVCVLVSVTGALAQRAGQMATIRTGTVVGMQTVDLNNADALKGAVVGGAFGAALTKSSKSSSRRRRNAAIGAVIGTAAGAAKKQTGRRYSVRTNEGTVIQIVTEQTEIRIDDCVFVEDAGGRANIRRAALSVCDAASQAVMNEPDIQAELQEEAAECTVAKQGLIDAETDAQMELAVRKIQILCYN